MSTVEERIDTLESILGQFIVHTDTALRRLEREMKAFKDEMSEESKKRNKEWSNLAKKMGTLVDDLIAPALRSLLGKYFKCDVTMEGQRMFRRRGGEDYEVDVIAACNDKVFMVEVRSTPRPDDVREISEKKEKFFDFFPEYNGKELFIIFGSITFAENVIQYASRCKVYVMGWREWEYMDILNFEEIGK